MGRRVSTPAALALSLIALICVVWLASSASSGLGADTKPKAPADPAPAARSACRQFIERSLHDPGSAEWTDSWTWTTSNTGDQWSVVAHYRAKNAFGAYRKTATHCLMNREGNDSWRLISKTSL
jgi:hypothetical protein